MNNMPREVALAFFSELYGGDHHIPAGGVREWGNGWMVHQQGELATFDADALTTLVLLAHDRCIRASVMPASPRHLRIAIHPRGGRTGRFCDRHPSIETALATWRHTGVGAPR